MSTYHINIFSLSDATTSVAGILTQTVTGDQWNWYGSPTLTVNGGAMSQSVEISDTDTSPGTFDDGWTGNLQQYLTSDTTIGGVTYLAGTPIEDEYEVMLYDSFGQAYVLVAIGIVDEFGNENIIGFSFEGTPPQPGLQLTYLPGTAADGQSMVPCFTAGTLIDTSTGPRRVEELRVGDLVVTLDGGPQPVRWIAHRVLDSEELTRMPNLRPVEISAGALGADMPKAPLRVSPQHRILIRSSLARKISGSAEVLVAAKHLCDLPGIAVQDASFPVCYVHFLLDRHHIVLSNGAASETLYIGPQILHAFPPAALRELRALFPSLMAGIPQPTARPLLVGRKRRGLVRRHSKRNWPLVSSQSALR
jgi:hypothetical protein